jgi:hypothetical protein
MVHIARAVYTTKPEISLLLDQKQRTVRFKANRTGGFNPLTLQALGLCTNVYLREHGNETDFSIFCINRFGRGSLHNFWLRNKKSTTAIKNTGSRRVPSSLILRESPILCIIDARSRLLNYFHETARFTVIMRGVVDSP